MIGWLDVWLIVDLTLRLLKHCCFVGIFPSIQFIWVEILWTAVFCNLMEWCTLMYMCLQSKLIHVNHVEDRYAFHFHLYRVEEIHNGDVFILKAIRSPDFPYVVYINNSRLDKTSEPPSFCTLLCVRLLCSEMQKAPIRKCIEVWWLLEVLICNVSCYKSPPTSGLARHPMKYSNSFYFSTPPWLPRLVTL